MSWLQPVLVQSLEHEPINRFARPIRLNIGRLNITNWFETPMIEPVFELGRIDTVWPDCPFDDPLE